MMPEKIQRLIEAGETLDIEFEGEEKRAVSDDELIEPVVCLANRSSSGPAWLLIGVEDDGRITGARPRNPLLADAFKRAGIVERTARGIDTIFFMSSFATAGRCLPMIGATKRLSWWSFQAARPTWSSSGFWPRNPGQAAI